MAKEVIFTPPPNGDENKAPAAFAVMYIFLLAALLTTIIRMWVRTRLTRNQGSDDYWMIATTITTLIGSGFVAKQGFDGLGRHMYYLSSKERQDLTLIGWLDWMQTFITICTCKISICMFLLRIKNTKQNKYYMYTLIALNVIITIASVGMFIGICIPPDAHWIVGKPGKCISPKRIMAIVIAQGIFSAITDIILATTPVLFLKDLQISRRTKIALCILMGAGYLTAVTCIVRTALSGQLLEIDASWGMVPNAVWRATEVNLGIICANAPIFRPLYLWYRGRLQSKGRNTNYIATRSSREGKSRVKLWSKRKGFGSGGTIEEAEERTRETERSGYTDATAELGLPIEGYMMGETGRKSAIGKEWMEEERGRMKA